MNEDEQKCAAQTARRLEAYEDTAGALRQMRLAVADLTTVRSKVLDTERWLKRSEIMADDASEELEEANDSIIAACDAVGRAHQALLVARQFVKIELDRAAEGKDPDIFRT